VEHQADAEARRQQNRKRRDASDAPVQIRCLVAIEGAVELLDGLARQHHGMTNLAPEPGRIAQRGVEGQRQKQRRQNVRGPQEHDQESGGEAYGLSTRLVGDSTGAGVPRINAISAAVTGRLSGERI